MPLPEPGPTFALSYHDILVKHADYYVATPSTDFFEMRSFSLAQGRLSCLRTRGSILQLPTSSGAGPSSSLVCRVVRISQQRSHTSGKWQKQWQRQRSWQWTVPPHRGQAPLLAAAKGAALGTAAFVKLSESEEASGDTGEMRMLEASRQEIAKKVEDSDRGFSRLRHKVVLFLDLYVWEPLCTGFRFLHLAVIFVPVILAIPAIWIGRRQMDRDNERAGTLWWYSFLVKGMEWAGPAFIKVCTNQILFSRIAERSAWSSMTAATKQVLLSGVKTC